MIKSLIEYLSRWTSEPNRIFSCFVRAGLAELITYGNLFSKAEAYAVAFGKQGMKQGDVVLIVLHHSPDLFYAFVGALIGGFIPAFLSPLTDRQEPELYWASLGHLLTRTRAAALVAAAADHDAIRAVAPVGLPLLAPEDIPAACGTFTWACPESDDVAFLQFSSGTTGLRKGVMLSHRTVLAQVAAHQTAMPLVDGDVVASWLPLYHDMGLIACFVIPLVLGIPVTALSALEWVRQPVSLFRWIEETRATHVWLPNFAFNHLMALTPAGADHDLSSVKAFINCSEPCKAVTFDRFAERFARLGVRPERLQTCYAMAEAVFAVTCSEAGRPVRRIEIADGAGVPWTVLSVGRPLPGFSLRIVDAQGNDLPDGVVGEIALKGACVFSGYHEAPDDTAAVLRDDWYFTGDLGFLDDGALFVTGRRKDVIIVNGRNYYAHDIEALAAGVPGVKPGRLAAIGLYSALSGSEEALVLAEFPDSDAAARRAVVQGIKATVMRHLGLAVRAELVPPGWLIKTSSGKLSRSESLKRYLAWKAEGAAAARG